MRGYVCLTTMKNMPIFRSDKSQDSLICGDARRAVSTAGYSHVTRNNLTVYYRLLRTCDEIMFLPTEANLSFTGRRSGAVQL